MTARRRREGKDPLPHHPYTATPKGPGDHPAHQLPEGASIRDNTADAVAAGRVNLSNPMPRPGRPGPAICRQPATPARVAPFIGRIAPLPSAAAAAVQRCSLRPGRSWRSRGAQRGSPSRGTRSVSAPAWPPRPGRPQGVQTQHNGTRSVEGVRRGGGGGQEDKAGPKPKGPPAAAPPTLWGSPTKSARLANADNLWPLAIGYRQWRAPAQAGVGSVRHAG